MSQHRRALGNVKNIVSENDNIHNKPKNLVQRSQATSIGNDKIHNKPKDLNQKPQPTSIEKEKKNHNKTKALKQRSQTISIENDVYPQPKYDIKNKVNEMLANKYNPCEDYYELGLAEIKRICSLEIEDDNLSVPIPEDDPDDFWVM